MQQRAAIARALVHDPKLVLMDEPFGALDALTREKMNLELLRIWKEAGKTIVFVTHGISEAVFLGTRVVVLTAGPARMADNFEVDLPHPRTLDIKTHEHSATTRGASTACSGWNEEQPRSRTHALAILDAATAEFARYGLGGARVDRIAERAGANKRMLYYYFGSKEALFLAVLEESYGHPQRGAHAQLVHRDPREALKRLWSSPGATTWSIRNS